MKALLDETVALRKMRESQGEDDEAKFMASLCEDQLIFEHVYWSTTLLYAYLHGQSDPLKDSMKKYLSLISKDLNFKKFEDMSSKAQILLFDTFVLVLQIYQKDKNCSFLFRISINLLKMKGDWLKEHIYLTSSILRFFFQGIQMYKTFRQKIDVGGFVK